MTPIVTLEGDIRLDLTVISSTRKADVVIGGVNIPSFGNREVTTRLRLRDGESNLLAGLLQESEQSGVTGFPGAIHIPLLKQLFSQNTGQIDQTDIIMLLTPHIVRTHEISENDLKPIYIGSQQNLGVGGPPPLIAPQAEAAPASPPVAPPAAPGVAPAGTTPTGTPTIRLPGGTSVTAPPGSSPVPGSTCSCSSSRRLPIARAWPRKKRRNSPKSAQYAEVQDPLRPAVWTAERKRQSSDWSAFCCNA